jgi:hypothetical protein
MTAHSPFLEGSFTPVEEETTAFDLPVTGRLPAGAEDALHLEPGSPGQGRPAAAR